jgi:multicomponent Na+:H+ antiporter subunit F
MYTAASIAIFITMGLALIRALLGPSVYDRVLAVNLFGTKTVLLLSVVAFLYGRPDFLDLALAYALINFIGVLAVLQFFENRQGFANETDEDLSRTWQEPPEPGSGTVLEKSPR